MPHDLVGNSQRGRQARTFDTKQIDQSRHAMLPRAIDPEIGSRIIGTTNFGPYTCITRAQAVGR